MRTIWILSGCLLAGCAGGPDETPAPDGGEAAASEKPGSGEASGEAEAAAAEAPTESARVTEWKKKLATSRISIDFEDAPFATVLQYIATQTGINVAMAPRVRENLESQDVRVNLRVEDIPVQSALNILFDFTGLVAVWKNEVYYVTTEAEEGRRIAAHEATAADTSAAARIEAKLDQTRVTPSFNDTSLPTVIRFFRDVSGLNILIDPAVFDETPEDALRITLEVTDVSMRDALNLILDMTNLAYAIRDGVMVVRPKKR